MLTGDNERVARYIASQLGIDEYYADLLPEDKVTKLNELKAKYGSVCMVEMVLMMLQHLLLVT